MQKKTVKGVEFIVHDVTTLELKEKFNSVILCDCMEHIPKERYEALFQVIRKHLKENGIVYISIPDPEYLNFVRRHRPELLQIIDNSIFYEHIDSLCKTIEFTIVFFNAYSIFIGNEYNEYLLRTKQEYEKKWFGLLPK